MRLRRRPDQDHNIPEIFNFGDIFNRQRGVPARQLKREFGGEGDRTFYFDIYSFQDTHEHFCLKLNFILNVIVLFVIWAGGGGGGGPEFIIQ